MFYKVICFILKLPVFILFNLKVHNAELFNKSNKRYLVCCNHINFLDPVILAVSTKRQIHFMGKKELFKNKILGYVFTKLGAFPVDRTGVALSAIKNSLKILNQDKVLGIFPEGTRVKGYNEENAKPGVAIIANKAKSNVIPVYIDGNYKFRGRINIYFGQEKNYFERIEGKVDTQKYTEVGKEILKDIYKLKK